MDLDTGAFLAQAWEISPSVALRPEPFGALAYHFGNRKLTFLKSAQMVEVVKALGAHVDARAALDAVGVPAGQQAEYAGALLRLLETGMIEARPEGPH